MPRMRTAEKVLDIIKEHDPETEVTLHYIRQLISKGKFPHTPVGRRKLVDADAMIAFIAAGQTEQEEHGQFEAGTIRRVEV